MSGIGETAAVAEAVAPRRRAERSDAKRNRLIVLDAAGEVFAAQGLDASMEDIAAAAGVGVGTVYRGFGSKAALIDSLFEQRLEEAVDIIAQAADRPSGWESLCAVMRSFVEIQTGNLALRELIFLAPDGAARRLRERIEPLLSGIVDRAKAEGSLRADFAATDIAVLTGAISSVAGGGVRDRDLARRHLELLLKGISVAPDPVPVPPPLSDDEFEQRIPPEVSRGRGRR